MLEQLDSGPFVCRVCEETHEELFAVSKCSHRFCQNCSIAYIKSQAEYFAQAKCLQQSCNAPLDTSLPIYSKLRSQTLQKILNYDTYIFLNAHPQYSSCKKRDCPGIYLKKQGTCNSCQTLHCKKCGELRHEGQCLISKEEEQMRKLNYRKCPQCRVWVQKNEGCQFIQCKCGMEFCYTCGFQFQRDPCRKKQLWQKEVEIKELMGKVRIRTPGLVKNWIVFVPRMIIVLVVMLVLTSLFPLVIVGLIILGAIASLFLPLVFCHLISEHRGCLRIFYSLLLVIFYPLLTLLAFLLWLFLLVMYPYLRKKYHHGFYDPFDKGLAFMAVQYLKVAVLLIECCQE